MNDNDNNIEIFDEKSAKSSEFQLPPNFITVGEIDNDAIRIYIKQDVYKKIEDFAHSDTKKELGSILIGDYSEELGKTHVLITGFIAAKYTDASAATLTFTHDSWSYIHEQHNELFPDKKMVGWQHTHPSYGIFLSNYDLFIHENFFNLPFQVAYVVDPINETRGFFQWKNEKIQKNEGFFIYDDVGKPIKISQKTLKKTSPETKFRISKPTLLTIGALLLISIVSIGLSRVNFSRNIMRLEENQKSQYNEMMNTIDIQNSTIQEMKEEILSFNETNNEADESDVDDKIVLLKHKVVPNDTLISICRKNGIDYFGYARVILAINGIDDPNSIMVGQTILIPINLTEGK